MHLCFFSSSFLGGLVVVGWMIIYSIKVSPWGEVQATTDHHPSIVYATLNMEKVTEVSVESKTKKMSLLYFW